MAVLQSHVDRSAEWFHQNRADMLEQLGIIDELQAEAAAGGGPAAMDRMRSRGKMPVRERISYLIDPDSPFYEISPLAGYCTDYALGAGLVMGIGVVNGVGGLLQVGLRVHRTAERTQRRRAVKYSNSDKTARPTAREERP